MASLGQHGREKEGHRPGDPVTVLTVDDQDYFRAVMREVLDAMDGFRLVGEAASGEEALDAVQALSPALVIIDKRMPGIGGIEASRRMTDHHPGVTVVITSIEDPDTSVTASCGAVAFVRKHELSPRFLRELWERAEARR